MKLPVAMTYRIISCQFSVPTQNVRFIAFQRSVVGKSILVYRLHNEISDISCVCVVRFPVTNHTIVHYNLIWRHVLDQFPDSVVCNSH